MKSQIGIGVLAIPLSFTRIGLIPGIFCTLGVSIVSTWSNYMIMVFKRNHRGLWGIEDAAEFMGGRAARLMAQFFYLLCKTVSCSLEDQVTD